MPQGWVIRQTHKLISADENLKMHHGVVNQTTETEALFVLSGHFTRFKEPSCWQNCKFSHTKKKIDWKQLNSSKHL